MIDEMKLARDAERATQAQRLLADPLLIEAFAELEKAYIEHWRNTHIDDARGRENVFIAVNVVGKVRDHFAHIIANGKLASVDLSELARGKKRGAI